LKSRENHIESAFYFCGMCRSNVIIYQNETKFEIYCNDKTESHHITVKILKVAINTITWIWTKSLILIFELCKLITGKQIGTPQLPKAQIFISPIISQIFPFLSISQLLKLFYFYIYWALGSWGVPICLPVINLQSSKIKLILVLVIR
jgi:hypothetical protein